MGFDIESIKRKMLVKYPFFGSVVASVNYKESKGIPTAGTDGKIIYYNPNFLENLSVEEQTFVFAHEVCHIAFNHILRSEGKDPATWNTATDAVINAFLKKDGLKIVEGGIDMADAINYDAEQLYEKLLQEKQQQQQQDQNSQPQQSQGGEENQNEQNQNDQSSGESSSEQNERSGRQGGENLSEQTEQPENGQQVQNENNNSQPQNSDSQSQSSDGQNNESSSSGEESEQSKQNSSQDKEGSFDQDVGHDTHSMWEDAVKKHKEEQSADQKKEKTEVEEKQEECEGLGEKDAFKENHEEKKSELEKLKELIAKQAGTTTNGDTRIVTDIGRAKPLIDWRYVLREAIKYDVDWSYRNATIENGVICANLEEQPMPETEIVLDTSGSINQTLLKNFLRECKNILQHSRLKVGCFDTKFYGFYEIRTEEDIETMTFDGGGGTDFNVAVGAFSRRVENKIIFTDGLAKMPIKPMDSIWIVFGGKKINPKGGRVINITEEQLKRLYSSEMDNPSKGNSR